jgi:SSS family solute:Na+ symporter
MPYLKMQILDLAIFLIYMLAIVGFGISFSFRKRTAQDFTTGGGRLPTWAIGMSIFATYVSSISFLALPGNAFSTNWNGFVFSFSIPLAAWIAVKYFVPLYRKLQCESAYFYLEQRFGAWARIYTSCCYLLTQLARMGAIMYLLALPMNALLGWSIPSIIILIGFSVVIYAMWGGIEAVIWTDAVQGILLIFGALACLGVIFFAIPDGPEAVFRIAADADKFSLGSFKLDFTTSTFWMILVYGLFINLQNFGIDQSYVQRYLTAKNEEEAKKATWLGSLLYVPVSFVFFFIGTALFAYYESFPNLLPEGIVGDKVFPYFIVNQLPVGMTGLLIASIFAAGMSTVSTSINSSATVILSDHFSKYIYPNPSEKLSLWVLRISSLVMGLLSILVGLAFNGVSNTLEGWWALSSIFSGGILGLFLLGLVSKAKNPQAIFAVFFGVLVICWMSLSTILIRNGLPQTLSNPLHTNMTIVIGTVTIFLLGFGLTWVGRKLRT